MVTWTRNSNHTQGLAADLTVNGGWTDRAGFEQLARVAREEGLRTLWPRDPGHIELVAPTLGEERVARAAPGIIPASDDVKILPWMPRTPQRGIEPHRPHDGEARIQPWVPLPDGDAHIQPWVPGQDGDARIQPWVPPREGGARILPFNPERVRAGSPRIGAEGGRAHRTTGLARVATVAGVAQVAKVADVARVASVGTPGTAANIVVDTPAAGGLQRPTLARTRRERNADLAVAAPTTGSSSTQGTAVAAVVDASAGTTGRGTSQREREKGQSQEGQRAAVDAIREADTALMRAAMGGEPA